MAAAANYTHMDAAIPVPLYLGWGLAAFGIFAGLLIWKYRRAAGARRVKRGLRVYADRGQVIS